MEKEKFKVENNFRDCEDEYESEKASMKNKIKNYELNYGKNLKILEEKNKVYIFK